MTGLSAVALANEAQDDRDHHWAGVARVVGPPWTRLPSLTVGMFGAQVLWSVEMSYASPYLLSLGLPKSLMAIVFLAGPLSGLIVQPLIGILSDNSKSRFGRRRPFIVVGTALCALSTIILGFTRSFASIFTTLNSPSNNALTIWLAILSIYCIDFSINAVQAVDRALLVDTLPTSKQPAGNAWAASMLAVGSVAGFFIGNINLPHYLPFLGTAQLEVLSVIAALLLFLTHVWMCFHVKERILLSSSCGPKGFLQELKELWETLLRLPSVIRRIFWIQFFAWLGWFPVLFYSTIYIGDLHKRSLPVSEYQDAAMALDAEATRLGTRALLYSALVSLATNIVVPSFVTPQHARHASNPMEPKRRTWLERVRMHTASVWALSHLIFATCMAATFVISTVSGATWIVSVTGFCWAITLWAPFVLLSEAILSHPVSDDGGIHLADTRSTRVGRASANGHGADEETRQLFRADEEEEEDQGQGDDVPNEPAHTIELGHARARLSRIEVDSPLLYAPAPPTAIPVERVKSEDGDGLSAQAGTILGIHNLYVVVPQFLVTGLSSVVFALVDPARSVLHDYTGTTLQENARGMVPREEDQGPDSIAIIFRLGGVSAAIAAVLCYRLARDLKRR